MASAGDQPASVERSNSSIRSVDLVSYLLLAVVLVCFFTLIWSCRYFPSQDGPAHLYNAAVLRQLLGHPSSTFAHYFRVNHRLVPNWSTFLILCGLMSAVSPASAEKLLISAYAAAFVLAANYLIRTFRRDSKFGFVLALPLVFNELLFRGSQNFCCGIPLMLFAIGYCGRTLPRLSWFSVGIFSVMSVALYFFHPVTFCASCLVVTLMVVAGILNPAGIMPNAHTAKKTLPPPVILLGLLPAGCLLLLFLLRPSGFSLESHVTLGERLKRIFTWGEIFNANEGTISAAVTCVFLIFLVVSIKARRRQWSFAGADTLLVAAVLIGVVDLFVPDSMSGGVFVVDRLNVLAFIFLALWLAVQRMSVGRMIALYACTGVLTAFMLLLLGASMAAIAPFVDEYVASGSAIMPNSTVLVVTNTAAGFTPQGEPLTTRVTPMLHLLGWIGIDRHAVDVTNVEASTGFCPLLFQPAVDVPESKWTSPSDFAVKTAGQGRIDQILIWTGGSPTSNDAPSLLADLAKNYRLVYRSPLNGYVEIYRRNDLP